MTDKLTDEEEQQLKQLRKRSQLEVYRDKLEEVDGVPRSAIDVTNTGIQIYDGLGLEARYNWIIDSTKKELENNFVAVTDNGTVHFTEKYEHREPKNPVDSLFKKDTEYVVKEGLRTICSFKFGKKKHVTDLDLSHFDHCKSCLDAKTKMKGGKLAIKEAQS